MVRVAGMSAGPLPRAACLAPCYSPPGHITPALSLWPPLFASPSRPTRDPCSGMIVFKLERERPAFATHGSQLYYIKASWGV